ncbi:hypothetical protein PGTUg99_028923 [Puccinia graminis f. sp. tritici]|uniref:Uncharacterized protein n=1 Tax=Puccinia graminis f. sp. tritici TaxID=56615 RepID=A0A5B0R6D7_PUCGR|nr:hypothetical protein PGTUg99_028923 [Puccinia graminis f. sp. tritici]
MLSIFILVVAMIIEVLIAASILPVGYQIDYVGSNALLKSSQQKKRCSLNEQSSSNLISSNTNTNTSSNSSSTKSTKLPDRSIF